MLDFETDKRAKVGKVTGSRGKLWIAMEDGLLCDAWMTIGQDPVVGPWRMTCCVTLG